jgi:hypothetical protein
MAVDGASVPVAGAIATGNEHHRSRLGEFAHGSVSSRLRRLLPGTVIEEVRNT